ncbi:hypothetical protein EDEG_03917, partial [Edhazardia aedis USNM 41457]
MNESQKYTDNEISLSFALYALEHVNQAIKYLLEVENFTQEAQTSKMTINDQLKYIVKRLYSILSAKCIGKKEDLTNMLEKYEFILEIQNGDRLKKLALIEDLIDLVKIFDRYDCERDKALGWMNAILIDFKITPQPGFNESLVKLKSLLEEQKNLLVLQNVEESHEEIQKAKEMYLKSLNACIQIFDGQNFQAPKILLTNIVRGQYVILYSLSRNFLKIHINRQKILDIIKKDLNQLHEIYECFSVEKKSIGIDFIEITKRVK